MVFQMQIGHDHHLIDGQLLVIVCLLKEILYRERARSKLWFRDLVLSLCIESSEYEIY